MTKIDLRKTQKFEDRHNGPDQQDVAEMLKVIGLPSVDALIDETVPAGIRMKEPLNLPLPKSEFQFLKDLRQVASHNQLFKSYIGMGYYDTIVPGVIQRNILENPGWYTAYTPYQAEIAQGRLEALINFQTMVMDLTGMPIANASLLDEATAAAEAMFMFSGLKKKEKKNANTFFVDENTFPQTIDLLKTRSIPVGINLVIGKIEELDLTSEDLYGVLYQYPAGDGSVRDFKSFIETAQANNVFVTAAADLMSLALLTPPGEMGADAVVGTTQRFGVPMGYGGPHAAYFATKDEFKRQIPGRIIGVSIDSQGNKAYRMALQTREQHIRREKATSNICTAQVLLGVMAGMYGVYHGSKGIKHIALKIHGFAKLLEKGLTSLEFKQLNEVYFDTLRIEAESSVSDKIRTIAEVNEINFRYFENGDIGISVDETTRVDDIQLILDVFAEASGQVVKFDLDAEAAGLEVELPKNLERTSDFMTHPVFNQYHSEHEMLRYIKKLENKDLSLVHSMISLGSCTMKLNATAEMVPVTWPEFGGIHPFAPLDQTKGYQMLFNDLVDWLSEITGFDDVSLQPNSGAQGEYAGLMVIRAYHESRGDMQRNVAIIPTSAHGTNPASAVMAGMKVVLVACDERGNIDVEDLKLKVEQNSNELSCLMVTYPSTHGVFEESIKDICQIVHDNGGQVYMDGANMNAQVGLTSPGLIGADVCHLNLHKTFCIPHGGGGPGMGPIGVRSHLAPFLPGSPVVESGGEHAITAVSAAPWGSASILTISYAYIAMMGAEGLTNATKLAILNANYIKAILEKEYKILYAGSKGRCAHEMIVDCRDFKASKIEVGDIAKRLMDYGFHAPTVSFPVAGTLMIEPTESESKVELDRFCEAMLSIRQEIREVMDGIADESDNVLINSPHTQAMVLEGNWERPYSREKAVYPAEYVKEAKFWPTVARIDSAYGDRNLMCSCIPVSDYAPEEAAV
ncbi:glycine dehydrogenase (decarboxylating) alpha subunit /glycine dehydrogenase (decarboxylating) beta subunit [Roseivirga ehrenbergii]|uniref:Glycine dehydrogenase (decarboxylating) n=1 Tax=Roseivirga ehrenbergii (strain DSM 102268 / JCM 13514 / KCTC 12282 / NCIMB 14502 / KMM 6017) TaxID=279360 RepID=A0A150XTG6_ROSEK|nr:aminomethyl-transferring glycine dehydrogenase [Roseivirga ehrenbergii]KYG82031.1 glycine dehydrogenase (aminomethyl-transferring) [Roseivirga ehrenbergii]TCL01852.1 glycine dehydrogenase (decarboxylating) alpha subunit /glycine dehydrogenase (decarboxylating) beta subunit [Roseivirga ehrenbergii]